MKTLLLKARAALQAGLPQVRHQDVFITPHEAFIPRGTNFPALGIKDGAVDTTPLMGGEVQDRQLTVKFILYVKMYSGEKSILGEGGFQGILDLAADVHAILTDNFLGIPEILEVTRGREGESESFGQPGEGIQRKILTYTYETRG